MFASTKSHFWNVKFIIIIMCLMHLKMLSAKVTCCIYFLTFMTNVSIEANIADSDHRKGAKLIQIEMCSLAQKKARICVLFVFIVQTYVHI